MRVTDVLRERVAGMSSEELAGVLLVDPGRYQGEFLELARRELQHRGFVFGGNGGGAVTTPDGLVLVPRAPAVQPAPRQGPSGIGGWLLIFILSNLACRPLSVMGWGVGPSAASISQVAEMWPTTALLLNVDKMVTFVLIFFGAAVSFSLLRKGSPPPVRAARIYLAVYPFVCMVLAALYGYSDLPANFRDLVVQGSMMQAVGASVWSLIWLLYFNRSKRVKATYALDGHAPG